MMNSYDGIPIILMLRAVAKLLSSSWMGREKEKDATIVVHDDKQHFIYSFKNSLVLLSAVNGNLFLSHPSLCYSSPDSIICVLPDVLFTL